MSHSIQNRLTSYSAVLLLTLTGLIATSSDARGADVNCNFTGRTFSAIEEIIGRLSQCYYKPSLREDREYMAAILAEEGLFQVVMQPGSRKRDPIEMRFRRRRSQSLVALWHTHGAVGLARNFFSATDTELSVRLNIPFYLTDPSGNIRRFDPDTKTTRSMVRRLGSMTRLPKGSSAGALVGHLSSGITGCCTTVM